MKLKTKPFLKGHFSELALASQQVVFCRVMNTSDMREQTKRQTVLSLSCRGASDVVIVRPNLTGF